MALFLAVLLLASAIVVLGTALARDTPATGLSRSLEALEQMSGPGVQELLVESQPSFTDRVLEPLQAKALVVGRRLTGADTAERIRRKLDLAGNPRSWTVDRVVSLKVLAAVALPVCGLAYTGMMGAGPAMLVLIPGTLLAVGFFIPDLYLYNRATHRSEDVRRSLADAIDLLTISVEAGLGFDAALQQVARNTDGPLAEEFSRVLREIQLGQSRSDALKSLGARTNVEALRTFVGAMVQADAFGIAIGEVLRVQSAEIRVKRRQHAEEKAQQVPVKIMIPLILCILPCLFAVVMGPAAVSLMGSI